MFPISLHCCFRKRCILVTDFAALSFPISLYFSFPLTAGNSIQNRINHIVVHVLLRNQPVQSISFTLYAGGDLGDSEISYMVRKEEATKLAQEVYDLFRLIIDTADQDRKQQEAVEQVNTQEKSTVQELKDLVELHEKGAISDEEFSKLKEKLIR